MVYRVIVVDDEYLDLQGLVRLVPWDRFGMQVEYAARSGFEALQYLRSTKVDLLVTDIRMPNLSGIELAQQAKELYSDLKILFISGYEDFQYAKRAIAMSACGYVLKPIDDDELFKSLNDIQAQLDAELAKDLKERSWMEFSPMLRDVLVMQWLEGKISVEAALQYLLQEDDLLLQHNLQPIVAAVVEIDDVTWKLKQYSESTREELIQSLMHDIVQAIDCWGNVLVMHQGDTRITIVLQDTSEVLPQLEQLVGHFNGLLSITAGLGHSVNSLHEAPESYEHARKALNSKMFLGKNRVISAVDPQNEIVEDINDLDALLDQLFTATAKYEVVSIHDCIEVLFRHVSSVNKVVSVYQIALYVISKLDTYLKTINENLYVLPGLSFQKLDLIYDFETVQDIETWLRKLLYNLSEQIQAKKRLPNRKMAMEVAEYVKSHLGDNLTLKDMSVHFGLTPNYLGQLFREVHGETFNEYLNKQRLTRAVELLQDPKRRVYEVAYELGYTNMTYFGHKFKEQYGLSPNEFRKRT